MEVHIHSHSPEKKNWKSYVWEFLMLFLAVFCGFLAENQREHMVEHNREKQYSVFTNKISSVRRDSFGEINFMEVYADTYCLEKMYTLFPGVSHVVSCGVLQVSGIVKKEFHLK